MLAEEMILRPKGEDDLQNYTALVTLSEDGYCLDK